MKIDEFRNKMCIPADASKDYIMKTFEDIADVLKNECVIKYGNEEYRILDFEFYFFNKNHQDISVHPRNSKALSWYVNEFGGIDLNFESSIEREMVEKGKIWSFKYNLTDNSYYGGILIRQIQSLSDDKKIFNGPLKVAELFRILDATSQTQSNPVLVMKPLDRIAFIKSKRHNLLGSYKNKENKYKAKADYNIEEWFTNVSDSQKSVIEDKFASFVESEEYRFCCK